MVHQANNPLNVLGFFSSVIIFVFWSLIFVVGFVFVILLARSKNEVLSKYIMSFFLVFTIALPIWYALPVNSPNNYYLSKDLNTRTYIAENSVLKFENSMYQEQKSLPPITTLPSMHVAWALLALYYLAKWSRKTLYFSIPWAAILIFSTVYLAQHYFVDVIMAILITIISIWLADYFYKTFNRKYQPELV